MKLSKIIFLLVLGLIILTDSISAQQFAKQLHSCSFKVGKNNSEELGDLLISNNLYFIGEHAVMANNGKPVKLYTYNPFNPSTKIKFEISDELNSNGSLSYIRLAVYNSLGQQIAVLVDEPKNPGIYEVEFNGDRISNNINLSRGIYYYS